MQQRVRRGSRPDACVVVVEFAFIPDFTYFGTDETQSLYRNEHSEFFSLKLAQALKPLLVVNGLRNGGKQSEIYMKSSVLMPSMASCFLPQNQSAPNV